MGRVYNVIFLSLLILTLSFVVVGAAETSVVQTLGTFKWHSNVTLKQAGAGFTNCNVTSVHLVKPNNSQLQGEVEMEKNGTEYKIYFSKTENLGRYIVNGFCTNGTEDTVWAYDFNVTTTGMDNGNTLPIFLLIVSFAILSFAIFTKNPYIGFFACGMFLVTGIYMMIYGLGLTFDMYTRTLAYITLGLGLAIGFASVYEMAAD